MCSFISEIIVSSETTSTSKNAGWICSDIVEFSRLGGLIGNYNIVAKPGTPVWLYHRTCSLLVAEGGLKIIETCRVGLLCH